MRNMLLFIFVVYLSFSSNAQNITFNKINVQDGLPHSTVNKFIQDSLGFIWVATDDGLARYDNHNFDVFNNTYFNQRGISNSQVLSVLIDSNYDFWVGTANSLELYDRATDNFKSFPVVSEINGYYVPVLCIFQNSESTLLLGTDGGGIRSFNLKEQRFEKLNLNNCNEHYVTSVSDITKDKFGNYWIASRDSGVSVYNSNFTKKLFKYPNKENKITPFRYSKVLPFNDREMILASYGGGLQIVDIEKFDIKELHYCSDDDVQSMQVFDMLLNDNRLYIGTDGGGLYIYDLNSQNWSRHVHDGSNSSSIGRNVIRTIFLDKEKNLWLGHYQGGISIKKNKKSFKNIPFLPNNKYSLSHSNVAAVFSDDDQVWIGTDGGGINILKNNEIYNEQNGKIRELVNSKKFPKKVLCIKKDSKERLWMGTYLEGAFIFDKKTKQLNSVEDYLGIKLNNKDIRCIFEDKDGKIWLGTNGGGINIIDLETRENNILKRSSKDSLNTLSIDWVRTITQDSYGFIWIGTSYGLNSYDPVKKRFHQYFSEPDDSTSLLNCFISYVYEDAGRDIWIGTGEGLYRYDRNKNSFKRYTTKDGLASNIISAICEDNNSNLWISTNKGLSKLTQNEELINYQIEDGLLSSSFINNSVSKDVYGTIYWGTINGLVYFKPGEITDTFSQTRAVVSGLKIHNKKLLPGQKYNERVIFNKQLAYVDMITVLKEENVITFDFAALTYSFPEKVVYEYKLEGFNDEWVKKTEGHSVTYTNLKTGSYTLYLKVGNMGEEQPVSKIKIKVLPPYYETWWFRAIIILTILALVVFIIKSRIDKIKREKAFLQKKYEIETIKSEQERANYEKLKLESEIKQQEADMNLKSSQLLSTTLLITNKNEIMNQVKSEINSFSKNIVSDEVKKGVEKLLKTIDSGFKVEDDWLRFEKHFDQVHKDFFKRLKEKHPELSLTYLKLIAYLRLDLSTKEIAALMNISTRGVEKSRYRLRKKLGLGSGDSLSEFISNI